MISLKPWGLGREENRWNHLLPTPNSLLAMKGASLPLSVTLRDLAILRVTDVDLSTVLDKQEPSSTDSSAEQSIEFAREARTVLKTTHKDTLEKEGARIEEIRASGSGILESLQETPVVNH
jgi:hypothetical protein